MWLNPISLLRIYNWPQKFWDQGLIVIVVKVEIKNSPINGYLKESIININPSRYML